MTLVDLVKLSIRVARSCCALLKLYYTFTLRTDGRVERLCPRYFVRPFDHSYDYDLYKYSKSSPWCGADISSLCSTPLFHPWAHVDLFDYRPLNNFDWSSL